MERLIKKYNSYFDEALHQVKFFPNPLTSFHQLNVLIHRYFSKTIQSILKNQQKYSFCWFFFSAKPFKKFI